MKFLSASYFSNFQNIYSNSQYRIFGLDLMRAIAILFVVYLHGGEHIFSYIPEKLYQTPIILDGVTIFFVLSGFLIGKIFISNVNSIQRFSFRDIVSFWKRRWYRTLPNYYLVLTGTFLIRLIIRNRADILIFSQFIFCQNLFHHQNFFFPESWSLSIEEWFYFLLPILFIVVFKLIRNKKTSLITSIFLLIIVPQILKVYYYLNMNQDQLRGVVVLRLDSIGIGVFAAYIFHYKRRLWTKKVSNLMALIGISLLVASKVYTSLSAHPSMYINLWSFSLESLIVLCFIPAASNWKTCKYKSISATITFISIISYSMYLLNNTFINNTFIPFLLKLFRLKNIHNTSFDFTVYIMYWVFTIYFSYLLYKFFEKPVMDLRDRPAIKELSSSKYKLRKRKIEKIDL